MNAVQDIKQAIVKALTGLGIETDVSSIVLEHPADMAHGDYATNVALQYAKQAAKSPRDLAAALVAAMGAIDGVDKIDIAGPGFINFKLSYETIMQVLEAASSDDMWGSNQQRSTQKIMVEYTDPNPFKEFHIGHLMSNATGEAISRLLQFCSAEVKRACYQGDVGLHVAKAIWAYRHPDFDYGNSSEVGKWSAAYAFGAKAYEQGGQFKDEINALNKKIYDRSDPEINALYDQGRKISLDHFGEIYKILGTKFDHHFFESDTGTFGKQIVTEHPEVFEKSDGAIVYKGDESMGLHTRVFINSEGLPTYEAKELGLAKTKYDTYPYDTSIVITGNEVNDYFKVLLDAMSQVFPDLAAKTVHISHGMMRLPTGKMSSRTGDVITGESLLNELTEAAKVRAAESRADDHEKLAEQIAVAAIKYQILKQGSGKDIIFDRDRALSFEGDSGPYLQYAYARTVSLLEKAAAVASVPAMKATDDRDFQEVGAFYMLSHKLTQFPDIVQRAADELEPHLVTTYLIDLVSLFSRWYGTQRIIVDNEILANRVTVIRALSRTLKNGLWILGIPAPEKM